jgi:hypothetical protein
MPSALPHADRDAISMGVIEPLGTGTVGRDRFRGA